MPRDDASAYTLNQIANPYARPVYFVRIGWDTGGGVDYFCNSSSTDITAGPNTYTGCGVRVGSGSANEFGNGYNIELPDESKVIRGYIDAQGLGVRARIHQAWMDQAVFPPTWDLGNNSLSLLDGIVTGAPRIGLTVTLECQPAIITRLIPHIACAKPTNNWNVPPGTVVRGFMTSLEVVE